MNLYPPCETQNWEPAVFKEDDHNPVIESDEGVKYDNDKPRVDLVAPAFIVGVAQVLTFGAKKYAAHNWHKGLKYMRIYASTMRHLMLWACGQDLDSESGLPHLDHAATNIMFLKQFSVEKRDDLDDRFYKVIEGL